MTRAKFNELTRKLAGLWRDRPAAATEVARLAQLGDFSENAEYQLAKGRLRGMNDTIDRLQTQIDHAEIIANNNKNDVVQIGSLVTVECDDVQRTFHILGSSETNPSRGIVSHLSPIGAALLGRKIGDTINVVTINKKFSYKIVSID